MDNCKHTTFPSQNKLTTKIAWLQTRTNSVGKWIKWTGIDTWCLVSRLRIALVFLGRKSRGKYFFLLYACRKLAFCVWLMTVSTWAMDSLTTLIFESLLGAPPVTLATLKRANSAFNSFNYIVSTSICKLSHPKRGQQSHHSSMHMVKDNRQIRRDQACAAATTMQYQAQKIKRPKILEKSRTWLRSSVLLLDRSSWTLILAMTKSSCW